jgi:hypothetical protein
MFKSSKLLGLEVIRSEPAEIYRHQHRCFDFRKASVSVANMGAVDVVEMGCSQRRVKSMNGGIKEVAWAQELRLVLKQGKGPNSRRKSANRG